MYVCVCPVPKKVVSLHVGVRIEPGSFEVLLTTESALQSCRVFVFICLFFFVLHCLFL